MEIHFSDFDVQNSRGQVPIPEFVPIHGSVTGLITHFDRDHRVGMHRHDHCQFVFVDSGTVIVMTGGAFWLVPANHGLWIPAMTDHAFHMTTAVKMNTIYVLKSIALDERYQRCCVIQVSVLLRELISRVLAFEAPYHPESPEGRLVAVLLDEIGAAPAARLTAPFPHDPRLQKLARTIARDPGNSTQLDEWASHLGASKRTIARLFQKDTGMSFIQWRQQIRLFGALQQLAEGKAVTEVAMTFGYNSTSAFISLFKKNLGTTPSRYFK